MNLELIKLLLEALRQNPHSYHLPAIAERFDYDLNYIGDEKHIYWITQTLNDIIGYTREFNFLYKLSDLNKTREHLERMRKIAPLIGSFTDVLEMPENSLMGSSEQIR